MRLLLPILTAAAAVSVFAVDPLRPNVTVHEWGTFTTVANESGNPAPWFTFTSADLPCFVERLSAFNPKARFTTTVRMETPVLYFYSPRPAKVSVRVDFPQGLITEWYPKASALLPETLPMQARGGRIDWNAVEILPSQEKLTFPESKAPSHYFAARETDAAPLRVNGQTEKMLFYRGVANFPSPVQAKYAASGQLQVTNTGDSALPVAIYFENRGKGKIGFRVIRDLTGSVEWDAPESNLAAEAIHSELRGELVRAGLFPKEAAAMIETWRDSWFEKGSRVFYLVPKARVDSVLPLQMNPAPARVERVFVGRVELLAPWRAAELRSTSDPVTMMEVGRFLDPFIGQIKRSAAGRQLANDAVYRVAAQRLYDQSVASKGCVQ